MELNDQILSLFKSLINDIIEILPEGETQLIILEQYSEILKLEKLEKYEDNLLIFNFLDRLNKISSKISNKDESIFDENIIQYIPIKTIWSDYMEDVDKNKIWKSLQTFCIININLNSSNELKKLLSGESTEIQKDNKKDIKDLKKIKKLKSSINDINKEEDIREKENNMEGLEGLEGVFENTGIGKLAKNIAENMDFESMMGDMGDMGDMGGDKPDMAKMMQNMMNPENFMNLFQNINSQVREQIDSGSISEEALSGEAESLYGNFANNPMFKNMMNNPELQKMQKQMQPTQGSGQNPSNNDTQERLRKKLEKRKQNSN